MFAGLVLLLMIVVMVVLMTLVDILVRMMITVPLKAMIQTGAGVWIFYVAADAGGGDVQIIMK